LRILVPHAYVTDYLPHGDGLLAYRYIRGLALRGHEIVVFSDEVFLKKPTPVGVHIVRPQLPRMLKSLWLLRYIAALRQTFFRLHREKPFDLIHQFNPVVGGISLGLAGIQAPILLGPHVRGWPTQVRSGIPGVLKAGVRYLEQRQAKGILLSGLQAANVIHYHAVKTYLLPFGIDLNLYPETPEPFPQEGPLTICFLGILTRRKGLWTLFEAFERLAQRLPNVRLLIAGAGEDTTEEQRVFARAKQSPISSQIQFLGVIPQHDVPRFFASGHVCCQPSYGEPYGMNVVEAMASGRPIVATAAGGFLDTVDTPQGGLLVAPGDANALTEALFTILTQRELAESMGAYNRKKVNDYAWPIILDSLEHIYEEVRHAQSAKT